MALGFWQFLTKKCVIFDKRVKKVTYMLIISNFGTRYLKFMKTCWSLGFWALFCPALGFLGNFAWPRFCTCRTSVPTFITGVAPPPSVHTTLHDPIHYWDLPYGLFNVVENFTKLGVSVQRKQAVNLLNILNCYSVCT